MAYDALPRRIRVVVVTLLVIVAPIALPAWGIERIVRRRRPNFEFRIFSSTPYFFVVAIIATVAVITIRITVVQITALYFLAVMEMLALATCAMIAIISPGRLQTVLRMATRRSFKSRVVPANSATIYAAIISAIYAVFFFGTLSYALWQANQSYFGGVSEPSTRLYSFWQFIQNSSLIITNAGATIDSRRFLSQLIGDFERMVGIFFFVFLLSVLASGWAERALRGASLHETRVDNPRGEVAAVQQTTQQPTGGQPGGVPSDR
jgi:hypothetical protein